MVMLVELTVVMLGTTTRICILVRKRFRRIHRNEHTVVDVTSLAVITRVEVIVVVVLVVLRPPAVMEACEMVSFTQSTIGMMEPTCSHSGGTACGSGRQCDCRGGNSRGWTKTPASLNNALQSILRAEVWEASG